MRGFTPPSPGWEEIKRWLPRLRAIVENVHLPTPPFRSREREGSEQNESWIASSLQPVDCLKLFISYSHQDDGLLKELLKALVPLQRDGLIDVWTDTTISSGEPFAEVIDDNLNTADIILFLISRDFFASDFIHRVELPRAMERHQAGEACVIPVILRPSDWTHTPLASLQALPARGKPVTSWGDQDEAFLSIARGIREVANNREKRSFPLPVSLPPPDGLILEEPGGPTPPDSPFYLCRPGESACCEGLEKPGALIHVRGPRSYGKSTLMLRLRNHAVNRGYRTVALDLRAISLEVFEQGTQRFMRWFCAQVANALGRQTPTEDFGHGPFDVNTTTTLFFTDHLLGSDPRPLVLLIDNIDQLIAYGSICNDYCRLVRHWWERKASDPIWGRFKLVLSYSLEPKIRNLHESPFNVGDFFPLEPFSKEEVRRLMACHGLRNRPMECEQMWDLLGGHPYLVRKALYGLANGLPFATFLSEATTREGLFSDHLHRVLQHAKDPEIGLAFRQLLSRDRPVRLPSELLAKLLSFGYVAEDGDGAHLPFRLHRDFLANQLSF